MKAKIQYLLSIFTVLTLVLFTACGSNDRITLGTETTTGTDGSSSEETPGVSREVPSDIPIIDVTEGEPVVVETTDPTTGGHAGDNDGDGYDWNEDCDDSNANINPGKTEQCDALGIDENCDGVSAGRLHVGNISIDSTNQNTLGSASSPLYGVCGIQGNLSVASTTLTRLKFFENIQTITGNLDIMANHSLTDVTGIANLESLGGSLGVYNNNSLTDFDLPLIESAQDVYVINNNSLSTFSGLNKLKNADIVSFMGNPALTEISGFTALETVRELHFKNETSLTTFSGFLTLGSANILEIDSLSALTSINGFNQLELLNDELKFKDNPNLATINGLAGLVMVSNSVEFKNNPQLPECAINSFLTRVSGGYTLAVNGSPSGVYYLDDDSDSYGLTSSISACVAAIPPGYAAADGDCDDSNAAINPGAPEIVDGLDNNCDGLSDNFDIANVTSQTTITGNTYSYSGNIGTAETAFYERDVIAIGDFNGDSKADLFLSAPYYTSSTTDDIGAICYFEGPLTAGSLSMTSDGQCFYGANKDDKMGFSIANIGDFNGDGCDDLAYSTPGFDSATRQDTSTVKVVFGKGSTCSSTGAYSSTADITFKGLVAQAGKKGVYVSSAGDVDQDGLSDLLIGAPSNQNGKAYLVYGSSSLTGSYSYSRIGSTVPGWSLISSGTETMLGADVQNIGDFNGDGYADFAIGEPYYGNSSSSKLGKIYLVFGKARSSTTAPLSGSTRTVDFINSTTPANSYGITYSGIDEYSFVGHGISDPIDINNDGLHDLIYGAVGHSVDSSSHSPAILHYGCQSSCTPSQTVGYTGSINSSNAMFYSTSDSERNALGTNITNIGDIDADGYSDIFIGNRLYIESTSSPYSGRAYLLKGKAGRYNNRYAITDQSSLILYSSDPKDYLSFSMQGGADLTGDGVLDVVMGTQNWQADLTGEFFILSTSDLH